MTPALAISYTMYITSYRRVKIQPSPSSKTSYASFGDIADPSKLAPIKKDGLRTLDKNVLLPLIWTCMGPGGPGCTQLDDKNFQEYFPLSPPVNLLPFDPTRPSTSPNDMVSESRWCNILCYIHNLLQTGHDLTVTVLEDILRPHR